MTRGIPRLRPSSIPLFSYGFRLFFLSAAIWACLAMVFWIGLVTDKFSFAEEYGGVQWHAHEFLFGYISAVLTGFLLTAIPNWTGRMPLQGAGLFGLWLLWLAGRIGMLLTDQLGNVAASVLDATYLYALTFVILREIVAGRNWRNLKIGLLVVLFASANVIFHIEVIRSGSAAYGFRIAIAAIVALLMIVGGRITPSFTHNWLKQRGALKFPVTFNRFDMAVIGLTVIGLLMWVVEPKWEGTAAALLVVGFVQALRMARWGGLRTLREPIVFILHLGYAFVPIGAFLLAISIIWPASIAGAGALHGWTTGAMGIMTLAVMTRASRGHTGHAIESTPATVIIYGAIVVSVLARLAADIWLTDYLGLLEISAFAWFIAFAGFVISYGPMLVRARRAAGPS